MLCTPPPLPKPGHSSCVSSLPPPLRGTTMATAPALTPSRFLPGPQVFARSSKFSLFDPAKEMVYIEVGGWSGGWVGGVFWGGGGDAGWYWVQVRMHGRAAASLQMGPGPSHGGALLPLPVGVAWPTAASPAAVWGTSSIPPPFSPTPRPAAVWGAAYTPPPLPMPTPLLLPPHPSAVAPPSPTPLDR